MKNKDKEIRKEALRKILKRRFNKIVSGEVLLFTEKSNEEFIRNLDKLIELEIKKMKEQKGDN